ncbi:MULTISPECIES: DUF7832 domain-containing protein [Flammeovirga]|uniref:DUF7832 domain-containing protein n=1 Tax=Flammeovirga agarivorans TaxID=2726742 RepID=A0A7X8XWN2_9BACT|nr:MULTISPECIES: hypothetical protein [Flammeovirga]NLR92431.1 hypothetical protein [Flammeovirga agarivorans]
MTTHQEQDNNIIDNVRNYFGPEFPEDISLDHAYIHIGYFFGWVILNDLYSEEFEDEFGAQIIYFKRKEITPTILAETLDGIIEKELFDIKLHRFLTDYYSSGDYIKDYKENLANDKDTIFHVSENWEDFDKMSKILDARFSRY